MRICLSMIVRDEAAVIERCLRSVRPFIDCWAISDTGSNDGTQQIVRRELAGLPGELIERPWIDFAHNRNEALELAARHGDYALVIDADEVLVADEGFEWPVLDAPGYLLELVFGVTRYRRVAMPRLDCGWQWRGVLHEALVSPQAAQARLLPGLRIHVHTDGARSQRPLAEKFAADAEVLRQALIVEPDNARYAFYLAQSLRDANRIVEALAAYRQRIAMGGWDEEVYQSMLQVALLSERSACAEAEILAAYLHAFDYRPSRAEAPCELARYCRLRERYALARTFAGIAATLPPSNDLLFVDASVAAWRARDELAVASYWCGDYARSASLCRELLASTTLPQAERARVEANLAYSLAPP
ncbi:MAG TPA: glycosyltransferase family 2 protein [Dokdonella sp.]|uniref:glycosyltransferase n=2 Tax=Dokdonella sp. TaxID=2291710 RepID=UPI002CC2EB10|nr:glycosyltransferase [Dokdonella sp.]HOX72571.1 glycosyltransferase family 2 protein [Dokdonella sp.]HPG94394.1 glycosyltransferase family 2 protein [Dokdonella sp.]